MSILVLVTTGILSVFFICASAVEILGWQKLVFNTQLKIFKSYALDRKIIQGVGFVELFAAIAILFQNNAAGFIGAIVLVVSSIGAIYFHLKFDGVKLAIPSFITLILSSFLTIQLLPLIQ
jgi:hypothetical protein